MADSAPSRPHRSRTKTALILVGVIAAMAIAGIVIGFAVLGLATVAPVVLPPPQVAISGTVTTKGLNTHPTEVLLVEQSSHAQLTAEVSGNNYHAIAPNGSHDWRVVVSWQGLGGTSGTCEGGYIQYSNNLNGSMSQDITC